jgi:CubicO group peptidase (beta-lactamase class C family)
MKTHGAIVVLFAMLVLAVRSPAADSKLHFPPLGKDWKRVSPREAGIDADKLEAALDYAGNNKSSGVVVLWKGRLLAEKYWPLDRARGASLRYLSGARAKDAEGRVIEDVASVQKSVVALLVGMAQERKLVEIGRPASDYLGKGWSEASPDQEGRITLRHLLTMTSGLNERLEFVGPAGSRWQYNSTAYSRARDCVAKASGKSANALTREWLTSRIGMSDSSWKQRPFAARDPKQNQLGFATTARDLARFGLLILARGEWDGDMILADRDYFKDMLAPSQELNPAYGYLWWLNGQEFVLRGRRRVPGPTVPNAPKDLVAANGALGRKCWVVPSLDLVVTRLGDQPKDRSFDNQFWKLMMEAVSGKQ